MAAQARAKAETLKDFAARKTMLEVARLWNGMAADAERTANSQLSGSACRRAMLNARKNLRRSLALAGIPVSSPKQRTAGLRTIIYRADPNGVQANMWRADLSLRRP
jgi:hypothetical protein